MPAHRNSVAPARPARAALCAFVLALAVAACDRTPAPEPEPEPRPPEPAPAPVTPPIAPMSRVELLQALDAAASSFVGGQTVPASPRLAGRQFMLVQAFGCGGARPTSAEPGVASVERGGDGALTLSLRPADWSETALIRTAAPQAEAVEGLWVTRPWLRGTGCPTVRPDPLTPGAVSAQTYGLAAIFEEGGSRVARRDGRAYRHVIRAEEGAAPVEVPPEGYRLVVEGRLTAFPDGRAVRCSASGPDQRPSCIAAVEIDRVAFTDAAGATLSEWRS